MNDKNAPIAPQFEDSILNSIGWYSPNSFENKQVIPFGPYLKDTEDLSAREYETTAGLAIQDLKRVIMTLIAVLVILPLAIVIVIIRILRK